METDFAGIVKLTINKQDLHFANLNQQDLTLCLMFSITTMALLSLGIKQFTLYKRTLFPILFTYSSLSPCHGSIVTGTYDEGENPSTTLFVDKENTNIGVAAIHHGSMRFSLICILIFQGPLLSNLTVCGPSVPYEGIVLDSWPLPIIPNNK